MGGYCELKCAPPASTGQKAGGSGNGKHSTDMNSPAPRGRRGEMQDFGGGGAVLAGWRTLQVGCGGAGAPGQNQTGGNFSRMHAAAWCFQKQTMGRAKRGRRARGVAGAAGTWCTGWRQKRGQGRRAARTVGHLGREGAFVDIIIRAAAGPRLHE